MTKIINRKRARLVDIRRACNALSPRPAPTASLEFLITIL